MSLPRGPRKSLLWLLAQAGRTKWLLFLATAVAVALAGGVLWHFACTLLKLRWRHLLVVAFAAFLVLLALAVLLRPHRRAAFFAAALAFGTLGAFPAYVLTFMSWTDIRCVLQERVLPPGIPAGKGNPVAPTGEEKAALAALAARISASLAWISNRDGNMELYLKRSLDAPPERLTETSEEEGYPCFSREGAVVYFARCRRWAEVSKHGSEILAYDLAFREERVVTRGAYARLSADGHQMTFCRNDEIWLRKLSDGAERRLYPDGQHIKAGHVCSVPAIRPDGQAVAFAMHSPSPGWDLAIAPVPPGPVKILTKGCRPTWQPDGLSLAWCSAGAILVSDTGQLEPGPLAASRESEVCYYPQWSNHPRLVVFSRGRQVRYKYTEGVYEVFLQDTASSQEVRLTFHENDDIHPALHVRALNK